jgi:SanA protein
MRLISRKLILRAYLPLLALLLAFTFYSSHQVTQNAIGKTTADLHALPYNRVGLLLGTCKTKRDHTTINPFWKYRLEAAYRLWKAGKISRILISGDNGWHGYNEPQDFADAFRRLGVPDSVLVFDFAGFRTHDSVIRCRKVFGQKRVTIISQQFHNERALYIAKHCGLDAVGYNAQDVSFRDNLYNAVREKMARVLMFADLYVLHTKPHFLGKKITIP